MVVDCSAFVDTPTCVLTLSNDFNIKLITLSLLLIYSFAAIYFSRYIDKEKSYMHYWGFYLSQVLGWGYVGFSTLFYLLLLNSSISLEIFMTIIFAFYLLMIGLIIGMSVYYGGSKTFQIFGFDDWNEFKDSRKDAKSYKKYG